MVAVDIRYVSVAAPIMASAALIVSIVSLSTDYWNEVAVGGIEGHLGLWKSCGCAGPVCECASVFDLEDQGLKLEDWFEITQAAASLAVIANAGAVIVLVLSLVMYLQHSQRTYLPYYRLVQLQRMAYVLLILAAVCNVVAVGVFAIYYDDNADAIPGVVADVNLSWSWGLAILAVVLELFALIITWLVKYVPAS